MVVESILLQKKIADCKLNGYPYIIKGEWLFWQTNFHTFGITATNKFLRFERNYFNKLLT